MVVLVVYIYIYTVITMSVYPVAAAVVVACHYHCIYKALVLLIYIKGSVLLLSPVNSPVNSSDEASSFRVAFGPRSVRFDGRSVLLRRGVGLLAGVASGVVLNTSNNGGFPSDGD